MNTKYLEMMDPQEPLDQAGEQLKKPSATSYDIVAKEAQAPTSSHLYQFFNPKFLLNSTDAWEADHAARFDLPSLNASFRESVPILKLLDWEILDVRRGYAETKLPLNANSSNQYITHQAALQLVAADYTGGLAMASLFHLSPVIGFWESKDEKGIYMAQWERSYNLTTFEAIRLPLPVQSGVQRADNGIR